MSDDSKDGATTIHASKGGSAGKWLLGGVAALVVAAGGYLAWKTTTPNETSTQTAYNDTYSSEPSHAGPLAADQSALPDSGATANDTASSAADRTRTASPARRSTRVAAASEETIGITPVNASTDDEDIIVNAPRRPIWARTPSARRLSALYPEHAREWGREGEAQLHCTVQGDGGLDCVRVEETPGGFGPAALRVARTFRHAPTLANGADAAGSPVNLRVVFRMEDAPRHG